MARSEAELLSIVLDRAADLRNSLSQLQNDQHLGRQWPDLLDQYTVLAAKLHSFNTSIHASFSDTTAIPVLKEEIDRVPLILRTKVLPEVEDAERALLPGWENDAAAEAALPHLKAALAATDDVVKASEQALTSLRRTHELPARQRSSETGSAPMASQAILFTGLLLGQGLRADNLSSEEQLKQALARLQAAARSAAAAASASEAGATSAVGVGLKRGLPLGVPMPAGVRPKLPTSKPPAPTVPGISLGGSATVLSSSSSPSNPAAGTASSAHAPPMGASAKPSAYAPPPRPAMGMAASPAVLAGTTVRPPGMPSTSMAKPTARSMYAPPPPQAMAVSANTLGAVTAKAPAAMMMAGSHSTSVNPAALINQNLSSALPKNMPVSALPVNAPPAVRTGPPPGTLTPNMLHTPFKQ